MSICPEKDLQSVYLDNELPEQYRSKFKEHLSNCVSCSKEVENLENIHEILRNEAKAISFSQEELNAGFSRLQAKMSYKKTTNVVKFSDNTFIKRIGPAMAAALVLAAIIPVKLATGNNSYTPNNIQNSMNQKISFIQKDNLLSESILSSAAIAGISNVASTIPYSTNTPYSTNLTKTATQQGNSLATIDIFRPSFPEEQIRITIQLTGVSGISSQGLQQEILTPVSFTPDVFK